MDTFASMTMPGVLSRTESQTTIVPDETPPGWLGRRTRLKVCLIVAVVVALCISLVVVIFKQNAPSHEGACVTKECVRAATRLIESMDDTVDPCEDFYQFACGGFLKKTIIPDDKTSVTHFTELTDENLQKLRRLVEEEDTPSEPRFYKILKNYFRSCVDTENIEKKGFAPLRDILRQMGGWPVLEGSAWDPLGFNWTHSIYLNRQLGYSHNSLFSLEVIPNPLNSSWHIIKIGEPYLGMPSDYLIQGFNSTEVQAYYIYQVKMAILLGADKLTAERELLESLRFEIQLVNLFPSKVKLMTIGQLEEMAPEIPWLDCINYILSPFHTVTAQEPLLVNIPEYLKYLAKLLDRTPKRVIANYMLWKVTTDTVFSLPEYARDLDLQYMEEFAGTKTSTPRWKECMSVISTSLGAAVGSMYVRELFEEEAKSAADAMVAFIRRQFEKMLKAQDWMDPYTRIIAYVKARAITAHVAYPPEALMDNKLAEKFDGLAITNDSFLDNMRNLRSFGYDSSLKQLRENINKRIWSDYSGADVNAFYEKMKNSINIPAGILQGVFFEHDQPKYMNFGGIGYVIGHEITHGFDNEGRRFDEVGNFRDWWSPETDARFVRKSQCIIYQYGNYTVPELNLKLLGHSTLKENIADNGGIKVAYQAYIAWTKNFGEEKKLPSLPYTPKQLFWLSAANWRCSKYRPEVLKLNLLLDPHSPARFRINGPFSNRPEFAEDWKCPVGSKLNPVKKCSIW